MYPSELLHQLYGKEVEENPCISLTRIVCTALCRTLDDPYATKKSKEEANKSIKKLFKELKDLINWTETDGFNEMQILWRWIKDCQDKPKKNKLLNAYNKMFNSKVKHELSRR